MSDPAVPALAWCSLGSLALGLVGLALGVSALSTTAMLVVAFVGVGSAPWHPVAGLDLYQRLTLSFVTSVGVLSLGSLAMTQTGAWYPWPAFTLLLAAAYPFHLRVAVASLARRGRTTRRREPDRHRDPSGSEPRIPAPIVMACVGTLACLLTALGHRHLVPDFYGYLGVVGWPWYAGLLILLLAVAAGTASPPRHRAGSSRYLASARSIPVLLLVLTLTATPALTYDGPRSQAAAKHIDFVAHIQSTHTLNSSEAVYNAFSTFFSLGAWLCDVTGIDDPLSLSIAWPVILGLFRVVVLAALVGALLGRERARWIAVTIAVLVDSINADYYSPQSLGFVLGFAVVAIALGRRSPPLPLSLRVGVVLLGGTTLAVTHQLSPYIVGGVLVVLAAARLVRPWWMPVLVLGPTLVWAALHWSVIQDNLAFSTFGETQNFRPPFTPQVPGLERLPVVSATAMALTGGILLCTALAAVTLARRRRSLEAWACALCPAVGLALIAANPYGQEGIFRAALFGIPWLAVLAAQVFTRRPATGRAPVFLICLVLTSTFLVSSFGLDRLNVIRPSDLAAIRTFQSAGGPRPPYPYHLMLLMPGDQPTSPPQAAGQHFIWSRDRLELPSSKTSEVTPTAEMEALTERFVEFTEQQEAAARLYALWSPVGAAYGHSYALMAPARALALRAAFRDAPYWELDSADDGTQVFRFLPQEYRDRRDSA